MFYFRTIKKQEFDFFNFLIPLEIHAPLTGILILNVDQKDVSSSPVSILNPSQFDSNDDSSFQCIHSEYFSKETQ